MGSSKTVKNKRQNDRKSHYAAHAKENNSDRKYPKKEINSMERQNKNRQTSASRDRPRRNQPDPNIAIIRRETRPARMGKVKPRITWGAIMSEYGTFVATFILLIFFIIFSLHLMEFFAFEVTTIAFFVILGLFAFLVVIRILFCIEKAIVRFIFRFKNINLEDEIQKALQHRAGVHKGLAIDTVDVTQGGRMQRAQDDEKYVVFIQPHDDDYASGSSEDEVAVSTRPVKYYYGKGRDIASVIADCNEDSDSFSTNLTHGSNDMLITCSKDEDPNKKTSSQKKRF